MSLRIWWALPKRISLISKRKKIKAIRFSTLESICDILDCQPGDLIEFVRDEKKDVSDGDAVEDGALSDEVT